MEFDADKLKDYLKLFCVWVVIGTGMATGILIVSAISKYIL